MVKANLVKTFQNFHSQEYFEKSFNATYVALITKKVGAEELMDYRSISRHLKGTDRETEDGDSQAGRFSTNSVYQRYQR